MKKKTERRTTTPKQALSLRADQGLLRPQKLSRGRNPLRHRRRLSEKNQTLGDGPLQGRDPDREGSGPGRLREDVGPRRENVGQHQDDGSGRCRDVGVQSLGEDGQFLGDVGRGLVGGHSRADGRSHGGEDPFLGGGACPGAGIGLGLLPGGDPGPGKQIKCRRNP